MEVPKPLPGLDRLSTDEAPEEIDGRTHPTASGRDHPLVLELVHCTDIAMGVTRLVRVQQCTGFLRFWCRQNLSSEAIDSHRQQLLSSRSLVIELVPTNNGLEIYNTSTAPSQREEHYAHHRPQRRDVVRRRAELNDVRVDAARPRGHPPTPSSGRRTRATDAITRAGAAAAPARSRASSRRSTA